MKPRRKPIQTFFPDTKARRAIREALAAYDDPSRAKPMAALVKDTAVDALVLDGMAEDTAAALVDDVWRKEFEIMEAN